MPNDHDLAILIARRVLEKTGCLEKTFVKTKTLLARAAALERLF
jgi:hypothetical protein